MLPQIKTPSYIYEPRNRFSDEALSERRNKIDYNDPKYTKLKKNN